jgi:hypothetical protein
MQSLRFTARYFRYLVSSLSAVTFGIRLGN